MVSTYDLSFELSPCSKHLTDVSIPLNELRLRYEIPHDKFHHHLVSNTDKTNDMHRFGRQKVQTQTESNFHSISQEPIITSRTHITIRNLQPVVGKQNTFTAKMSRMMKYEACCTYKSKSFIQRLGFLLILKVLFHKKW